MQRKIHWEKWVNPLTGAGADSPPDFEEGDEVSYQDSYEKGFEVLSTLRQPEYYKPKLGHVIVSPMGLIPMNEHGDPAIVYNFWMAHTNFDITPHVQKLAESVPGVESWDTFTRYRARVSFGKTFDSRQVKYAVQEILGCNPRPAAEPRSNRDVSLARLKKFLATEPAWVIFELSDGQLCPVRGSKERVQKEIDSNPHLKILSSWKENETR